MKPPFTHFPNSPPFPTLPQNPNPDYHPSLPPPHLPPPPPPPPKNDLPTILSSLKDIITLSQTTLDSLPPFLRHSTPPLCPCPYNPHHRIPPHSLFRHSLSCPSPTIHPSLLHSLRYPKTLTADHAHTHFIENREDCGADLCFSLDASADFPSNFFYRDCPGVVVSADREQGASRRTFTLPGVLLVECADYGGDAVREPAPPKDSPKLLLPSDSWAVRAEFEVWSDYPSIYSYRALQVILHCQMVHQTHLQRWVISNSPLYGIVVDVYMGDHILLLFRLCLKAVVREALGLVEMLGNGSSNSEHNIKNMSFRCPIMVEVLMWLATQLSALYGEVNAKHFVISMLKQWLSTAALEFLSFSSDKNVDGTSKEPEIGVQDPSMAQSAPSRDISVSQIAAAVGALHERSLLEEKLKGLRSSHLSTNKQRVAEHEYISNMADEVRQKRSNYRPIPEYDGLLSHRSRNEETGKLKTREELLAEERDYKRRRMSYRGKKLKQTTTQVLREIIDEYMEEIKQAGGIGSCMKGCEKTESTHEESYAPRDIGPPRHEETNLSEAGGTGHMHAQSHYDYDFKARLLDDVSAKDIDERKISYPGRNRRVETRSISRDHHNRNYYLRSPEGHRNRHMHEQIEYGKEQNNDDMTRTKNRIMHHTSTYYHDRQSASSTSYGVGNSSKENNYRDREFMTTERSHRSRSYSVYEPPFDDRYDPSESRDIYEDG